MDVDLRRLRYLVALAAERNYGRAAATLGIAQPSLSQAIARLEAEVGVRLVDRDVRPVALTAAGDALVRGTAPALARIDAAVSDARAAAGAGRPFRLGLPRREYARHPVVARLVAGIRARLPGSRVELLPVLTGQAVEALTGGTLDAAVVYSPVTGEGIDVVPLFPDSPVVIMPPGHRLAARAGITLAELEGETLVTWSADVLPGLFETVATACRRAGFEPRVAEAPEEPGALGGMVADGVGVAIVSRVWAEAWSGPRPEATPAPAFVARPLVNPRFVLSVVLAWRADADGDPARALAAAAGEVTGAG